MSGNGKQPPPQQRPYTSMQCTQRPPTPQRGGEQQQQYHAQQSQGQVQGSVVPVAYPQATQQQQQQQGSRGVVVGVGVGVPPVRPLQPPTPPQPQSELKSGGYGQQQQQQGRQQPQQYQYRTQPQQQAQSQRPVPQHHRQQWPYTHQPMIYSMNIPPPYTPQGAQRQASYYQQMVTTPVTYYPPYQQPTQQFYMATPGTQPQAQISMTGSHPQGRVPPVVTPTPVQQQQQPPQQPQPHQMHPIRYQTAMQMTLPPQPEKKVARRTHAIAIVDPLSGKNVMEDILESKSREAIEERRPSKPNEETLKVVTEFTRLVTDKANEKDSEEGTPPPGDTDRARPRTPVVSAISDSPEIVPKQIVRVHQDTVEDDGRQGGEENERSVGGARVVPPAISVGGREERQSAPAVVSERPVVALPDKISVEKEISPAKEAGEESEPSLPEKDAVETRSSKESSDEPENSVSAEETESEDVEEVRRLPGDEVEDRPPAVDEIAIVRDEMDEIAKTLERVDLHSNARDEIDDATISNDVEIRPKTEIVIEEKVKNDENATEKSIGNEPIDDGDSADESPYEDSDDEDDEGEDKSGAEDDDGKPVMRLRYAYKDDQWSPLNTSGKKCYDAEFLLLLRDDPNSKKKPENFNRPELMADNLSRVPRGQDASRSFNMRSDMLPGFARNSVIGSTPNRKSQHGMKPNSKSGTPGGMTKPNVINLNFSLKSDVKLNESENAWKPSRSDRGQTTSEEEVETQTIYKKFRSILNKLTPQKFDKLVAQVRQLNINTFERLEGVINLVFEKAINEPNFSVEYASLCKELSKINVILTTDQKTEKQTFYILIVNKCREEFLKCEEDNSEERLKMIKECTDPEKKKELEEEERNIRRRSVGNVRFIGELYKLNFINNKNIVSCIEKLIKKKGEETLECLCKLLTTIGKDLEQQKGTNLNNTFDEMKKIVKSRDERVSSRIRFMIQDVIELRDNNWVPRQTQMAKPKTMDQIKLEVEMEQNKNSFSGGYASSIMQRNDDRPSNMNKRGGSRSVTEDGWSQPIKSRSKQQSYIVDSEKLRGLNFTPVTLASFKPSTDLQMSWSRGSNTHKKADSNMISNKMPMNNRKNTSEITLNNSYAKLDMHNDNAVSSESSELTVTKVPYKSKGASVERSTFKFEEEVADSKEKDVKNRLHSFIQEYGESPEEILDRIKTSFKKEEYVILFKELILWSLSTLNININKSVGEVTGISVNEKTISNSEYLTCLKYAVDHSKVFDKSDKSDKNCWKMVSSLICTHLKFSYLSLRQIHTAFSKVIDIGKGFSLLTYIVISEGKNGKIEQLWKESDMKLSEWMDEDEADQFLEEIPFSSSFVSEEETLISPDAAYNRMLEMMENDCSRDELTLWIKDKVGASDKDTWFVRALTQAIFMYVLYGKKEGSMLRFDGDTEHRLEMYSPLLITHLSNGPELELQCLFAIQQLMNKLEHPRDIARKIFEHLLESDVISTKGFLDWKNNDDPSEMEGKGVMLKYLNSFLVEIETFSGETSESENGEDH